MHKSFLKSKIVFKISHITDLQFIKIIVSSDRLYLDVNLFMFELKDFTKFDCLVGDELNEGDSKL